MLKKQLFDAAFNEQLIADAANSWENNWPKSIQTRGTFEEKKRAKIFAQIYGQKYSTEKKAMTCFCVAIARQKYETISAKN